MVTQPKGEPLDDNDEESMPLVGDLDRDSSVATSDGNYFCMYLEDPNRALNFLKSYFFRQPQFKVIVLEFLNTV